MQIAMLFVRSNWAMMVIFTSTVLMQTLDTFTQRELHDRIPSSERAATTSLLSSVGRGAAIPLSILIGYLTDKYDFFATIPIYVLFSILLGAILVFVTLNRHHQEPKLIINDPLV
jgi:F0F1-type ATP synthase assembly protein I